MLKLRRTRKLSGYIIGALLIIAGIIPIISSDEISPVKEKNDDIGLEIATRVAITKIRELQKLDFSVSDSIRITNEKGETLFFLFTLKPQGYLVVTNSYNLPPVIAYSFTSTFQNICDGNPLYDLLYADILHRLENVKYIPAHILEERHHHWDTYSNGNPALGKGFEQWPPEGSTPTGGWLLTNWNQNAPYNNLCPLDISHGGSRSVAGCPAVAMAQILNYHNTTNNVSFNDNDDYYHSYLGNNYWIDNNYVTYGFPSFPQLNSYLATLQSHYQNHIPLTNNDKAAITFACGVAAKQVYAASGSGTFGVDQAYDAYQRFNCTTIALLNENDPYLYERLSGNMKDALPAHLAVVNPEWTMGHNLVVDGYNTDNYYHLNFGWGGSYNGWYLIPDEIPYGLTVIEGVIINIMKEDTGIPDLTCNGTLEWRNVTPCETVLGSFSVSNSGEPGSNLDWKITEWPSWGTWTFIPSDGNNLKPENSPVAVHVKVVVPNQEHQLFTGYIKVVNIDNCSDYAIIPVTLETGSKIHEKLDCNGSLVWVNIKPRETIFGSFTVENVGAALSNLSWEITDWPDWGTWTFTPQSGDQLTPEDGPVTINVTVIAPLKRNSEFTGQITIVNSRNHSDYDTILVSLATPYNLVPFTIIKILQAFMERFHHTFPLLSLLLKY